MILELFIQFFLIFILVILSGFFSASEIAIVAIRRSRLKSLINKGNPKAKYVEKLKNQPEDFFAIVQIGMTVTATAASAIGTAAAIKLIGPLIRKIPYAPIHNSADTISVVIVVILISYLFLVLAELVPKALAIRKTVPIALWAGPLTWYAFKGLLIIIKILTWSTNICLRLLSIPPSVKHDVSVTEEEILHIVKEGYEKGVFEEEEHELIRSVFEFTDTSVKRAMTPRTEIIAFEITDPVDKILRRATEERFSRYPVYQDNLDNIRGIIHSRDLLYVYTQKELFRLEDILREPYFVPDSKKITELLREMQREKLQLAIVLDEFGGTDGLISMEDVLEEIVGDIKDEYDDDEGSKIEFIDSGTARVDAYMPVDEFAHEFSVKVPKGNYETVGGMIVTKLGKIPRVDEVVDFDGFTMKVRGKEGNRIKSVIAIKKIN